MNLPDPGQCARSVNVTGWRQAVIKPGGNFGWMIAKKSVAQMLSSLKLDDEHYRSTDVNGNATTVLWKTDKSGFVMVQWTEQFATGSSTLDQQHQMLIANINHLESMLSSTNPTRQEGEFLIHLVDFLQAYADAHFQFEEHCMEKYRCPVRAKNKLAHEQFLKFIHEFKNRSQAEGFRVDLLRGLHRKLSLWIQDHLLAVDTQLRPCIKG